MNILVMGAGSIGSLFGGLLSLDNDVTLIGRKPHMKKIEEKGLKIVGKTDVVVYPKVACNPREIKLEPDVILLTVKSYDTERAICDIKDLITEGTMIMSLQNGLDNLEKILSHVKKENVVAAVTTEAAMLLEPGVVEHTGKGKTVLGHLGDDAKKVKPIVDTFNRAGLRATISTNIQRDIWRKAIVNSCINPVTAIFGIRNGKILESETLQDLVERVCKESTSVANSMGMNFDLSEMKEEVFRVIRDTANNYSSMVQSLRRKSRTEIDSINGYICNTGKKNGVDVTLNELLTKFIKIMEVYK